MKLTDSITERMITVDERRIDPTYLVTLAVVAETHNLSDAAKILGISQPGVSQQLKHLSEAVGQRLHVRSGHGVELTVAGLDLARRARDVLRSWRGVLDYVESVRQGNDGMLLLAASNTVSAYVVPRWLVRFRQRYPGVDLRSRSLNSAEVVERVIDGEAEVGVIESPVESLPPELVEIVVGGDRLVYVVSPAVVSFANNQVVGWGEVARIPLVLREVGSGVRRASEQALRARGLAPGSSSSSLAVRRSRRRSSRGSAVASCRRSRSRASSRPVSWSRSSFASSIPSLDCFASSVGPRTTSPCRRSAFSRSPRRSALRSRSRCRS